MYQKSWWYDLQFVRYSVSQTEIVNYGSFFALLPPSPLSLSSLPKTPKIQCFEKMKKVAGDTSFYTCIPKTKIIWGTVPEIWNKTDRIFCHFWPFSTLLPYPLTTWKIKILKKWKEHLEMSFYTCVPKMMYDVWFLR